MNYNYSNQKYQKRALEGYNRVRINIKAIKQQNRALFILFPRNQLIQGSDYASPNQDIAPKIVKNSEKSLIITFSNDFSGDFMKNRLF